MSNIALRAEGLSKEYRIGRRQAGYRTLRDTLADAFIAPFRRAGRLLKGQAAAAAELNEKIWALKDVSFEIKQGDVVGIIGRNGAGKSTLLKILSRITEPTLGFAEIYGRVGSLLEVGTGFHAELTGRENIYLNGAILGMSRAAIGRKFDEIVAFAEIEQFIETPVKHYSTGMYLRLAFAVAAHLEPEILIVDEVLAVGDADFQRKCLGRMEKIATEGRTVILVSHNMAAIQSLCNRALLLHEGGVAFEGSQDEAVKKYCAATDDLSGQQMQLRKDRSGGEMLRFFDVQFLNPGTMTPWKVLVSGQPVIVRISYLCKCTRVLKDLAIGISFCTSSGTHLFGCNNRAAGVKIDARPDRGYTDCVFDKLPFKEGRYYFNLFARDNNGVLDWLKDAGVFDVGKGDYYGSGEHPAAHLPGVLVDYRWQHEMNQRKVMAAE